MESKEDLIREAIRQLLRIAHKYARIERLPIPVDEGIEVSTKEVHTLQAIGDRTKKDRSKMSVTDVANHFGVTKSAASQIISRLSDKGFLNKKLASHSNKEYELALTELGWRAYRAHERFHGQDMATLLKRLDAFPLTQIATFSVMLETVGAIMDERLDA